MSVEEHLEAESENIICFDIVKNAIKELKLIRRNQIETEKYFDDHLFADARCRLHTNNFNGPLVREDFVENENEISIENSINTRMSLLKVMVNDESFLYAKNALIQGTNSYFDEYKLPVIEPAEVNGNTDKQIEEVICNYKEDYPKTSIWDFLEDEDNLDFFDKKR